MTVFDKRLLFFRRSIPRHQMFFRRTKKSFLLFAFNEHLIMFITKIQQVLF